MPLLSHTCRRGGTYHFRIRVPQDLIIRFQQKELKSSLRTTSPTVARTRSILATQHCLQLFDFVRQNPMLGPDKIRELAQSHFRALLQQDRQERRLLGGAKAFASLPVAGRAVALGQRAQQLACLDFSEVGPRVTALLADAGCDANADGPTFEVLCELVLRAELSAIQCQQYRDDAKYHRQPDDDLFRLPSIIEVANGSSLPAVPLQTAPIRISTVEEAEAHGLPMPPIGARVCLP